MSEITARVLHNARALADLIEAQPELGPVSCIDAKGYGESNVFVDLYLPSPVAVLLAWADILADPKVESYGGDGDGEDWLHVQVLGDFDGFKVKVVWGVHDSETRDYLRSHEVSLSRLRTMVEAGVSA